MYANEALRRLRSEEKDWINAQNGGGGQEVFWVLKGLGIAIRIIKSLAREQHKQNLIKRPRLYRYIASDMYRAMNTAVACISRGDPGRAAITLNIQIERVRQEGVVSAANSTEESSL